MHLVVEFGGSRENVMRRFRGDRGGYFAIEEWKKNAAKGSKQPKAMKLPQV